MESKNEMEEAKLAEGAAHAMVEKEKAKCRAAIEAAEASQRIAELESQKRINAEKKALKESEEKMMVSNALSHTELGYRKYTIEEIEKATDYFAENCKIGEGGYGPVYECYLDHTSVAVKLLRPDADQGRSQFQQVMWTFIAITPCSVCLYLIVFHILCCLALDQMGDFVSLCMIPSLTQLLIEEDARHDFWVF